MPEPLRRVGLAEQIVRDLRAAIIVGDITNEEHLAEDALAARYGVSRGPVREALRTLETEGVVHANRGRYRAHAMEPNDVDDLYELRRALEVLAIRRVALSFDETAREPLAAAIESMAEAHRSGDDTAMSVADLEFHSLLYRLAGNRRLLEHWSHLAPTFEVLFSISNLPDPDGAVADHERLLALMAAGDADAAATELVAHLERGEHIVRANIDRLSEARAAGADAEGVVS